MAAIFLAGCWEDRGPCDLWAAKLRQGLEPNTAIEQLGANGCVAQRALLAARLDDPKLGADAFASLVALGRSPEAEAAVLTMLGRPETVGVAATQAAAWELAGAEAPIRAALADPALVTHHLELYDAALAVAPAHRWIDAATAELVSPHVTVETADKALAVLSAVDWKAAPVEARGPVVDALADLLSRPAGAIPPERLAIVARELARVPRPEPAPEMAAVATRAEAGDRAAFLLLWAFGHPAASRAARTIASAPEATPGARAAALAYLAAPERTPDGLAALVETAPGDDAVLAGLALLGGRSVTAALAARADDDKGTARAAAARALAVALPADRLDDWAAGLSRQASVLMRQIPDDPVVAAWTDGSRACGDDASCWVARVEAALPNLDDLSERLAEAEAAVDEARKTAQEAVAADAARARELAKAEGDDLKAARAELEGIQARRDAAYAKVAEATKRQDALTAVAAVVPLALRRAMAAASDAAAQKKLSDAALAVLRRCRGAACEPSRVWAVAALRSGTTPPDLTEALAASGDDPALACLLAVDEVAPK